MRRMAVAAALAFALLSAPAAGQQGRLYEPFPDSLDEERIGEFVAAVPGGAALAGRLTAAQLDRGVFVRGADPGLDWPVWPTATARAVPGDLTAELAPPLWLGAAPSATPREFFGIQAEDAFAREGPYRERQLDRIADLGVGLVRQTFDWAQIERRPGRWTLDYHDRYVAALAERRLRVLPVLFGAPQFRSSRPARGAKRGAYPPRRPSDMARYARVLVKRYGPDGSLWRERPDLPRLPVTAWQIWNEPNLPAYWPSGPDAAEYAELLDAVGSAIEAVDPRAEIVTAGLPQSRLGVPFEEYVAALYDAGAQFDSLGVHTYARRAEGIEAALATARRLIDARGDDAALRLTEVGWATGGPASPFTVGASTQAQRIERLVPSLASQRDTLGLKGLVWFNWRDARPFEGGRDFFGLHTGLLTRGGRAKPGLAAFRRAVQQAR